MSSLTLTTVLLVFAATIVGAGIALFPAIYYYRAQIAHLNDRLDHSEKAKVKANELLLLARQQTEALQQELSTAKRDGAIQSAAATARATMAAEQAKVAREKAKADLIRSLDANDPSDRSAMGFADTQPMGTGFGALARR
jgi:septal ring factor EnvC (AmiA/AmiB activator)